MLATALLLGVGTWALATPPGFITDLPKAQEEALSTGKLIFLFFNMDG